MSLGKIGYDASEVSVGWCWVRIQASDRVLWMLLTGKMWEFLAYLTLPVLYVLIKRHIHIAVKSQLHASLCGLARNHATTTSIQSFHQYFLVFIPSTLF